jgi:hypothetical protein
MNKKLLLLSLISVAPQTNTMDQATKDFHSIFSQDQSQNLNQKILNSIITTAPSFDIAVQTIRHFEQTSPWKELCNEPNNCLDIIKHCSKTFNLPNEKVALALQIPASSTWYLKQLALENICQQQYRPMNPNVLQALMQQNVDFGFTYGTEQCTPLIIALKNISCTPGLLEWLIEKGQAHINNLSENNWTALMYSVYEGNTPNMALALLKCQNIEVNHQDNDGNTPLLLLLQSKRFKNYTDNITVVKKLLEKGADPELANNEGIRPLDYARETGKHREVVQFIEDAIIKKHAKTS